MENITSEKVFEVIAVYFANCYWNPLYKAAKDAYLEGQIESLEESYRTTIERYHKAFCGSSPGPRANKHYLDIIKDLHQNYRNYLQTGQTLMDFIDTCTRFFLPKEYYKTMARQDPKKDVIFKQILTKTLTKFTAFVLQEEVARAVKKEVRNNQEMQKQFLATWKKKIVEILTGERNEFCSLIMAKNSGVDLRNKEDIPTIPKEVCDKMQGKIRELIDEKAALAADYNKLVEYVKVLKKLVSDRDSMIETLKKQLEQNQGWNRRPRPPRPVQPPVVPTPAPQPVPQPVPTPAPAPVSAPAVEVKNHALEQLENTEFQGEEPVEGEPPVAVEEAGDLPSDGELQADD